LNDILERFPWIQQVTPLLAARYNIAPTQPVLAIANDRPNEFDHLTWGLVPSWAKDPSIGNRMINARAETLAEKPSFRNALRRRRCLIIADGFYEWKAEPGDRVKTPMFVRMKDLKPFGFAGVWEHWQSADGSEIRSCAIVTTKPNGLMAPIHDRMPAIIRPADYREWLDPGERGAEEFLPMLGSYPAEEMRADPVSRFVNSPKNEGPRCVESPVKETLF
jgi:putative SOS response-associated peptidase YedK